MAHRRGWTSSLLLLLVWSAAMASGDGTSERWHQHLAEAASQLAQHCQIYLEDYGAGQQRLPPGFHEALDRPVVVTTSVGVVDRKGIRGCRFPLHLSTPANTSGAVASAMLSAASPLGVGVVMTELSSSLLLRKVAAMGRELGKGLHVLETGKGGKTFEVAPHQGDHDRPRLLEEIKVSYIYIDPYIVPRSNPLDGFDVRIWRIMSEKLKVRLQFVKAKNFNDIIHKIANNQADFGASQPNMNVGRYKLADIAYPMFERIFYFKNRKPGPVDSFKTLSYPFEAVTWIWIAAAMAAGVLAFTTLSLTKLRPFVKELNDRLYRGATVPLGLAINAGFPRHWVPTLRKSAYGTYLLWLWLPTATLLSLGYESNLRAGLIAIEYEKPVETFQDMLDVGMRLAVPAKTVLTILLDSSPLAVVQEVNKKLAFEYDTKGILGYMPPEVVEGLLNREVAELTSELQLVGNRHLFKKSKDVLLSGHTTYYLKWDHPLEPAINSLVARLVDTGLCAGLRDSFVWTMAAPEREHARRERGRAMKISERHLLPLWPVFGFGLAAGLAAFYLERRRRRRKREAGVIQVQPNPNRLPDGEVP